MSIPRVTLEQWAVLQAVVDHGGYAQAAEKLYKSQSSVSYAITKLQQQLGIEVLRIDGRKARLTVIGEVLLRRARHLLSEAQQLEALGQNLTQGWEPEIHFYVDAACPTDYLMQVLRAFRKRNQNTHVQLTEVVLSGAEQSLREGHADLVVSPLIPPGFLGDQLLQIEFIAVAHHGHVLHRLQRELTVDDLVKEQQIIIRDSGVEHSIEAGWQDSEQRWTVSGFDTAVAAVVNGLGFSWLPRHKIESYLQTGELLPLSLREGVVNSAPMNLIFGKPGEVGPATHELAELLRQFAASL